MHLQRKGSIFLYVVFICLLILLEYVIDTKIHYYTLSVFTYYYKNEQIYYGEITNYSSVHSYWLDLLITQMYWRHLYCKSYLLTIMLKSRKPRFSSFHKLWEHCTKNWKNKIILYLIFTKVLIVFILKRKSNSHSTYKASCSRYSGFNRIFISSLKKKKTIQAINFNNSSKGSFCHTLHS